MNDGWQFIKADKKSASYCLSQTFIPFEDLPLVDLGKQIVFYLKVQSAQKPG